MLYILYMGYNVRCLAYYYILSVICNMLCEYILDVPCSMYSLLSTLYCRTIRRRRRSRQRSSSGRSNSSRSRMRRRRSRLRRSSAAAWAAHYACGAAFRSACAAAAPDAAAAATAARSSAGALAVGAPADPAAGETRRRTRWKGSRRTGGDLKGLVASCDAGAEKRPARGMESRSGCRSKLLRRAEATAESSAVGPMRSL